MSQSALTWFDELTKGAAYRAFREFVPPPEDRIPLSWSTFGISLSWLVPYLFMAYLVRRADTHLIRILLLPTVMSITMRCTYSYTISDPHHKALEWARFVIPLAFMSYMVDFAFAREGRLKIGEKKLVPPGSVPAASAPLAAEGKEDKHQEHRSGFLSYLPLWLADALEVGFAVRGVGWDFGQTTHFPTSRRPQERGPFIRATAISLLLNLLILDLCNSLAKSVPGVGDPSGGSIYLSYLPESLRYVTALSLHILAGIVIQTGLSAGYDLFTLVGVGIMRHPPSEWPPIFDNPWASESLHELWGRRWHQLLRRTFLLCGGNPGRWIAGNAGFVLGSFLASGLFHQIGFDLWDNRPLFFFMLQGVGILLEHVWRKLTGRRVGGILGRLWVYLDMFILGQMATDAWCMHGLAGALLVPPGKSVFLALFGQAFESLRHFFDQYRIDNVTLTSLTIL